MKMLVSVNISKGFSVWLEMAKSLNSEMEKVGVKMVWSGTNPDESKVFMIVDMKDPSQMKTFGEREDVAADGTIGELADNYFSCMGGIYSKNRVLTELIPALEAAVEKERLDLLLLVPL